jgi:hypothetical protein
MAWPRHFSYDLQELNEWVRLDLAKAQLPLERTPCGSYDVRELNEWVRRDVRRSPLSSASLRDGERGSEHRSLGMAARVGILVGVLIAGTLLLELGESLWTALGW